MDNEKTADIMSYSIYADSFNDNNRFTIEDSDDETEEEMNMIMAETPPDPFPQISRRTRQKWVEDSNAPRCKSCDTKFRFYVRRSHCRACGSVFCSTCVKYRSKIPRAIEKIPSKTGEDQKIDYNKTVKLCEQCYEKFQHVFRLENLLQVFSCIDLDLYDFKNISMVCKEWRHVGLFYLSKFREIQYKLPYAQYNQWEKDALWRNRFVLKSHNLWQIHVVRSLKQDHQKMCEVIKLYYGEFSELLNSDLNT